MIGKAVQVLGLSGEPGDAGVLAAVAGDDLQVVGHATEHLKGAVKADAGAGALDEKLVVIFETFRGARFDLLQVDVVVL